MKTKLLVVLLIVLSTTVAHADRRLFAYTYEAKTMPEGGLELEYYMTTAVVQDRLSGDHRFGWSHQVEVEYGVTDWFDVSMYQMFGAEAWVGYKIRTRARPAPYGAWPVDLMFYVEFIQEADGHLSFEEKVVLSRRFGDLVLSLDSTVVQGRVTDELGIIWNESLGVAYEFVPWFSLGVENQLRMGWEPRSVYGHAGGTSTELTMKDPGYYVGPTVALASGPMFWNLGVAFRAVGDPDDARYIGRVLWGISL